jgi:hypothetical protein
MNQRAKDNWETIVFNHDNLAEIMTNVLDIVKNFVQENKRPMVGGMAIDIALRSVGKFLYPDDKLPDYDFISACFHKDAYDLGNILAEQFESVSVIRAYHVSTMKTRVFFQESADITFVPFEIMQRIPTLEHGGFVVVHPHYQMIDQHRALSTPYEKPPLETISGGRWKKDIERFDMLLKSFPLNDLVARTDYARANRLSYSLERRKFSFNKNKLAGLCLSGFSAVAYWGAKAEKLGWRCPDKIGKMVVKKYGFDETDGGLSVEVPLFSVLTDEYEKTRDSFDAKVWKEFRPVLDKIPRRAVDVDSGLEILDNRKILRSASKIDEGLWAVNLQDSLCYLLALAVLYGEDSALEGYLIGRDIVFFAAKKYETEKQRVKDFLPSAEVYGCCNIYESIEVSTEDFLVQFEKKPRELFVPRKAFPEKGKPVPLGCYNFDPMSSVLYQYDGVEVENEVKEAAGESDSD